MKVLLLGGTSESRALADRLIDCESLTVVTSLAGRVRDPLLPAGEFRIGGFGGAEGLATWIRDTHITAIVDATHPFAANISRNAEIAAEATHVPLVVLRRPQWAPEPGDTWLTASSTAEAAALVATWADRALLTIGRQGVDEFAHLDQTWFLIRSIDPPSGSLPRNHKLFLERGPFELESEIETMRRFRIDTLVTKNSGGAMTSAKIVAARALGVPVIMIQRPPTSNGPLVAGSVDDVELWLRSLR